MGYLRRLRRQRAEAERMAGTTATQEPSGDKDAVDLDEVSKGWEAIEKSFKFIHKNVPPEAIDEIVDYTLLYGKKPTQAQMMEIVKKQRNGH